MSGTTQLNPTVAFICRVGIALGCAGLLVIGGFWLGTQVAPGGDNSGWFDTRGINQLFASLIFGCGGVVGGLIGGYFLGRFLCERQPQAVLPVTVAVFGAPILFVVVQVNRASEARRLTSQRYAELAQQESVKQMAHQKEYLASPQYAETVDRDLAALERFKAVMGPITYPGSRLVSSPSPRGLLFETGDSFDAVESFFEKAPVTMGYRSTPPHPYGYVYYKLGSFTGAVYVQGDQGPLHKTSLAYSIEGS